VAGSYGLRCFSAALYWQGFSLSEGSRKSGAKDTALHTGQHPSAILRKLRLPRVNSLPSIYDLPFTVYGLQPDRPRPQQVNCQKMPGLDNNLIRHALNVAREHGFAEVEIEAGGAKFAATLERAKKPIKSTAPTAETEPKSNGFLDIKATLVGYYGKAEPALEPGKTVSQGDVIAVISALGLANEVESQHSGEVTEVLVKDGDPVQYGQVLARIKVNA
jgi:biotin carboxyl carrier protein